MLELTPEEQERLARKVVAEDAEAITTMHALRTRVEQEILDSNSTDTVPINILNSETRAVFEKILEKTREQ